MKLLHWHTLHEMGRIPHSDEGHAVDAIAGIDSFGAPLVEIIMVSHRWSRRPMRAEPVPKYNPPNAADHAEARQEPILPADRR